ncbi:MAG: precorrin-6y C5,15-methyltransferase (decarboxylating) subunit CbiE, partial [Thermodesulfobacteriota bacterium]|nr:precorrin-6y C5,15-methyltransferase (decarboxylating) subunit CbiE [Thermodesulfobacteriota bacterium]
MRVSPNTIIVVGMGMSPGDLSRKALAIVEKADILIGGKRHLSYFAHLPAEKVPLYKNFDRVIRTIKAALKKKKRIVVIASGDPGYHGIARYLIKHLGKDTVEIIPNITTFQAAFARIKESWDDALLLSAHGHPLPHLASLLRKHNKIGILTDEKNTPAAIARQVLEKDPSLKTTITFIFEQLGTEEEKVRKFLLKNVVGKTFSSLNAMILFPPASGRKEDETMHLGLPDKRFSHQGGLITKEDIRIFTLAKLNLPREGVFWDVGSGSGSVAVEASLLAPDLKVYAIEKHKKRIS